MLIFDPTSTKEEKDMLRQSFTTNNVMCCRMLNSRANHMVWMCLHAFDASFETRC